MRTRLKAKGNDDDQIGEIIERRDDGRITIRFDNGRLLMAREPESFERVSDPGPKAKGK